MDTNESTITSTIIRELINNYHYDTADITVQVEVARGMRADAVVYDGSDAKRPIIIIEAKAKLLYPLGVEQLASIMRSVGAPYGILTDGMRRHYLRMEKGEPVEVSDIPPKGEHETLSPEKKLGMHLQYALDQAYSLIKTRESLSPFVAMQELNKILLVAIYLGRGKEHISRIEDLWRKFDFARNNASNMPFQDLFDAAKEAYPEIFPMGEKIRLRGEIALTALQNLIQFDFSPSTERSRQYLDFIIKGTWNLGQYVTPPLVATLMARLARPIPSDSVMDPACGAGSLLFSLLEHGTADDAPPHCVGMDINPDTIMLCRINLLLMGADYRIVEVDNFLQLGPAGVPHYDIVAIDPPLGRSEFADAMLADYHVSGGRRRVDSYALFIEGGLRSLKEGGRMIVAVPHGMLSMPPASQLRRYLANDTRIMGIIGLPKGAYLPYSGIDMAVLVLERRQGGDGNVFIAQLPSLDAAAMNKLVSNFQAFRTGQRDLGEGILLIEQSKLGDRWDPRFYLTAAPKPPENAVRLGSVVKVAKGIKVPSTEYFEEGSKGGIPYIRISDMVGGGIDFSMSRRVAGGRGTITVGQGDVLLSASGTIGKVALVYSESEVGIPSAQVYVLRADRDHILPEYLAMVLMSSTVQEYLDVLKTGQYISYLAIRDLREVALPVPDLEKQANQVNQFRARASGLSRPTQKELRSIVDAVLGGEH